MNQQLRFPKGPVLDRILTLELARVTERAAVAAARLRGRGDERAADQAAVDAMRRELNMLPIDGKVVIGEGERDEAPMLYIGEEVGTRAGPKVDIALDPLEGTTIAAKNLPNALAVIAIAEEGSLLNAPDVYMEKIAIGPGYPKGVVDLDAPPEENIRNLARAKDVAPEAITALVEPNPGSTADEAELIAHVKARLAHYKAPKRVLLVDTVARAANGKLDYRRLKSAATQHPVPDALGDRTEPATGQ